MRDSIEKNSSGCCSLKISNSEQTTVISKDLGFGGHYLGEYSGFIVIGFPNLVFWAV